MIGKLKKGSSFGGCIRYVTGKDEAKIIVSDGVLLGTNAEITQSFELQRQLNPRIKKPVGHIALSFKPEAKEFGPNPMQEPLFGDMNLPSLLMRLYTI